MRTACLEIRLNRVVIGHLYSLGSTSAIRFADDYASMPAEARPVLSLSFAGQVAWPPRGKDRHRYYAATLPPFFDNLLPEGAFLNLIATASKIPAEERFAILAALGEDLPGAVTLVPGESPGPTLQHDGVDYKPEVLHLKSGPIRFSLAGTQLKFSVYERENKLVFRSGGVGGRAIVKVPSAHFRFVPENEYTCLKLAEAVGVRIPQIGLIRTANVEGLPISIEDLLDTFSFVTFRFDRDSNDGKIHIEDFAQALGIYPSKKYEHNFESLVNVAVNSVLHPDLVIEQFVKRSLVDVLVGNSDGHIKNWSLIYQDGIHPELAPAYDVVSTIPYIANHEVGLKIAGCRQFREVNEGTYKRLAERVKISEELVLSTYRRTLEAALDLWPSLLKQLPAGDFFSPVFTRHWHELTLREGLALPEFQGRRSHPLSINAR